MEVRRLSFLSRSETLEALRGGSRIETTPTDRTAEVMRFTIQWQPRRPGNGESERRRGMRSIKHLPLVTHVAPEDSCPPYPGHRSGVFRAHAEKIVRTVLGTDATLISTGRHDEFNQLTPCAAGPRGLRPTGGAGDLLWEWEGERCRPGEGSGSLLGGAIVSTF